MFCSILIFDGINQAKFKFTDGFAQNMVSRIFKLIELMFTNMSVVNHNLNTLCVDGIWSLFIKSYCTLIMKTAHDSFAHLKTKNQIALRDA